MLQVVTVRRKQKSGFYILQNLYNYTYNIPVIAFPLPLVTVVLIVGSTGVAIGVLWEVDMTFGTPAATN